MKTQINLFKRIFLLTFLPNIVNSQRSGGGGRGGGGGMGRGFRSGYYSGAAAAGLHGHPICPLPSSDLTAGVWAGILSFLFVLALLEVIFHYCWKKYLVFKKVRNWSREFPFDGSFKDQVAEYHGLYRDEEKFYYFSFQLNITDNNISGIGVDEIGNYTLEGRIVDGQIRLVKQYVLGTGNLLNIGHKVIIRLCPTRHPYSAENPVMLGFYDHQAAHGSKKGSFDGFNVLQARDRP